jgi:hypothetical protein
MRLKNLFKKSTHLLVVAIIGLTVGLSIQFARAWNPPTAPAPGNNIAAPITTVGGQTINGRLDVTGDIGAAAKRVSTIYAKNIDAGNRIALSGTSISSWSAVTSPWRETSQVFSYSASDCNGNWTSWHTVGIYLPRYTTGLDFGVNSVMVDDGNGGFYEQKDSGSWIDVYGYNSSGAWSLLGYDGANCRLNGNNVFCGWGNQDPGNNRVSLAGMPSDYYISIRYIGYCHYGSTHGFNVKVNYATPIGAQYPNATTDYPY